MKLKAKISLIGILFIFSTTTLIPISTFAAVPNAVDVTIRIKEFDRLYNDGDWSNAGDIFFKISYTSTATSGVAYGDYEDDGKVQSLSNNDFDGSGYYNKQYYNIRFDTGRLYWYIYVYDHDPFGGHDLLFKGKFTVKTPSTTGSRSYNNVHSYACKMISPSTGYWVTLIDGFSNGDCSFYWEDGAIKNNIYNGITLWVSLYFKRI